MIQIKAEATKETANLSSGLQNAKAQVIFRKI